MPFIHIKSLPFDPPLEISAVVKGITRDFAEGSGVGLEHVTATWEFIESGHYAVAGAAPLNQPRATHPVLVDLLSPDFNPPEQVEKMLHTVAQSVSVRTGVPIGNIFINHRHARSGMVFDAGKIVKW
jgi:phenylpyruvate tautomerase PptA (4-oxalocrotonate tautomerase family)